MYTSGSTGVPKGVLLTHKNIVATLKAFCDAVEIKSDDVFLGFLPLAHVFELLAESVCLLTGVPIGYSSPLTMIDSSSKIQRGSKGDASVLHPTCLTAVPVKYFNFFFFLINITIIIVIVVIVIIIIIIKEQLQLKQQQQQQQQTTQQQRILNYYRTVLSLILAYPR